MFQNQQQLNEAKKQRTLNEQSAATTLQEMGRQGLGVLASSVANVWSAKSEAERSEAGRLVVVSSKRMVCVGFGASWGFGVCLFVAFGSVWFGEKVGVGRGRRGTYSYLVNWFGLGKKGRGGLGKTRST